MSQEDFMLVLSRKPDESIVIDKRIIVTVLEICGSQIRLGIEAPREIPVMREELIEAPTVTAA
jgi:carbon storage regulator